MRVQIMIDGMSVEISTRDPELLARWLGEVFTAPRWTLATHIEVNVWPSVLTSGRPEMEPDWIADSRIITRWTPVASPQEFVHALQRQVSDLAAMKKEDARR